MEEKEVGKGKEGSERKRKRQNVLGPEVVAKYRRLDSNIKHGDIRDKKLRAFVKKTKENAVKAAVEAAKSEMLLEHSAGFIETEGMEKTYHVSQQQIADAVDIQSATKSFALSLPELGPYSIAYSRNGRNMLLGGKKGHLALLDWSNAKMLCELQVRETVRDVVFLHDHTMWAAAQKKYVYIYDQGGMELHCLKKHINPNRLAFLPYHFLLVSVGMSGYLTYQDTSTGNLVYSHSTHLGSCDCMEQNPANAVIHLGHSSGEVTLWTPNFTEPVVKMFCHRGPVLSIAIDPAGHHMATSGLDGRMKVWDLRTYKMMFDYVTPAPAASMHFSQKKLLSLACGPHVQIWKDVCESKQEHPYLKQYFKGETVSRVRFCPYEDALGVGHSGGVASLLVPGSGEPNYDTFEADPFETRTQRREATVKRLLEKIQPESIMLNASRIGTVDRQPNESDVDMPKRLQGIEEEKKEAAKKKEKKKARGKSKADRKLRSKNKNIIDENRLKMQERMLKEKEKKERRAKGEEGGEGDDVTGAALSRFRTKSSK